MNSLTSWDKQTKKGRMGKKKTTKRRAKTLIERWYNGKIYIHLPFLPFKLRIK